ncbi:MAG: neutral/alkaline non-lysosomal ceramidase N-terminal domain-containing protein, partial [Pirellulaceae bacterium]|nr:neutral/alkaline non-lysosomal ceramidase N-terminal domain-containing protein [Pirellulaceae bacterium]
LTVCAAALIVAPVNAGDLRVGFADRDITPDPEAVDVWLAGYTPGRLATGVHDRLHARALVLDDGERRLGVVSVDLVGMQHPQVERIRERLKGVDYVIVCSTHNHEGPDTIGIWGRSFIHRGVDDEYMDEVIDKCVSAVQEAADKVQPAAAHFGVAQNDDLLRDSRRPVAKDGKLRTLRFVDAKDKVSGLLVQWNCHPEALGSDNTEITADYPHWTIARLRQKYDCPVVFVVGAVGGLMAPPKQLPAAEPNGEPYYEGQFELAEAYGNLVGDLAIQSVEAGKPIQLTPITTARQIVAAQVQNSWYRTARILKVVRRPGYEWTGDYRKLGELLVRGGGGAAKRTAIRTEVAYVRCGDLGLACIPGELYPELVYGQFQEPADAGADYPEAELEPTVQSLLPDSHWMVFGLANDEIGYIIPKRQWDLKPPFAYGRKRPQYGEINSCGVGVAPTIMSALRDCVEKMPRSAKPVAPAVAP